jgi:hypothetical protein
MWYANHTFYNTLSHRLTKNFQNTTGQERQKMLINLLLTGTTSLLDLSISLTLKQAFMMCTLAYYLFLLYRPNPYSKLVVVFFALMFLSHFLYTNETRILWYLVPATLIGSNAHYFVWSRRIQPYLLAMACVISHRLIVDHIPMEKLLTGDYTTLGATGTLILLALFSLK